jgi:hypothetical protein
MNLRHIDHYVLAGRFLSEIQNDSYPRSMAESSLIPGTARAARAAFGALAKRSLFVARERSECARARE